jgi:signal transduction histidine kinase
MRNALTAAIAAFSFIRAGSAPASGRTGEVLDRSLRRIHVLVENLLVDARMQSSNRATPERCAMDALVEEAADSVSLEAAARRVRVVVDVPQPIEVAGNAAMLSSAISNLLHNAVKFTHADGTVTIRLSRTNGRAVVSVEDQCGGLPVGAPERLFAPFVQGATNRDGVGLGLSIVHDVAEWHGGSIRAENRAGAGCVFYLDIPCG